MSFSSNKIFNKKNLSLFLAFLVLGVVLPVSFASAFWSEFADKIIGGISAYLLFLPLVAFYIFYLGSATFVIIAGSLLKWVIGLDILLTRCDPAGTCAVDIGWQFTRDLANIFFILFLVIIAFATILKIESYGMRRLLPILIIVALLINFSQLFVGIIVDFWNALTGFFISKLTPNISDYWDGITSTTSAVWGRALSGGVLNAWSNIGVLIELLIMGIFNLILGFMLAFYFLIFFMRIPMLWMLTILAPVYFVCAILPYTKGKFDQWIKWVLEWASIGFWAALFLYLGLFVIRGTTAMGLDKTTFSTSWGATGISGNVELLIEGYLPYLVAVAFLALGAMTAFETNALFSGAIVGGAKDMYGKYVSPQAWGKAGKKWGTRKVREFSPGEIARKAVRFAKDPKGTTMKYFEEKKAKARDWADFMTAGGLTFRKEKKEKIEKTERKLKDLKDPETLEARMKNRESEISEKIEKMEEEKGEKLTPRERKAIEDQSKTKIKKEETEKINKETGAKKEELEKEKEKSYTSQTLKKLSEGNIGDVSQMLFDRGLSRTPILSQTELAKVFQDFGSDEMASAAYEGEAKKYSSDSLADRVAGSVSKGLERAAEMKVLSNRGNIDKLFEKLATVYNVPEKDLLREKSKDEKGKEKYLPIFKQMQDILGLADKANIKNNIVRGDMRLAAALAGTKGYENLNAQGATDKFVDDKIRAGDIKDMTAKTFEDPHVLKAFASTKGELGYWRTLARELPEAIEPVMEGLNKLFEDELKGSEEEFKKACKGFSDAMEYRKNEMKSMGYDLPWKWTPKAAPTVAGELGIEEKEEKKEERKKFGSSRGKI